AGRHGAPVRRPRRRHRLHAGARLVRRHEPAVLAVLAGHLPHRRGAAGPRRHHGRALAPVQDARGGGTMSAAALQTHGLGISFGAFHAVSGVNLSLEPGARQALIGPNGAGKTTLINLLTGIYKPSAGRVLMNGEDVTALSADRRARRGLARTF